MRLWHHFLGEHKIYGSPRFCNTHFDVWLACVNLSGITLGKDACALMGSVSDVPKNLFGFKEPFFMLGSSSSRSCHQ
ncbi:hypothetical protein XBFFL1_910088 [Xenorhabdus bovienii str. feltiae Florida]|nr:hypothetical protein XBFFR1_2140044 [Xenorhabdus bovienii str. feltiae France]CDG94825.1 hypothetical protein XBFFL1_910088 [Xenorhabdus bovienii str. feltiae Florida]